MTAHTQSVKLAFACLHAAGTFRKLAADYATMANDYPRYAAKSMADAAEMKQAARWHIRHARGTEGPRLP